MKAKLFSLLTVPLLSCASLQGANIAWVSFHAADDAPSGTAGTAGFTNAPDVGYTALLRANGHNVTRFVTTDNIDQNPDLYTAIDTNDLVIISRSVPSGHYELAEETAVWNSITSPMIIMGGYILRNNRLGFTTGTTVPDVNSDPVRLRINTPGHPIFQGVSVDTNRLMVNPYARIVSFTNATTGAVTRQVGISVNNNAVPAGGNVLAVVGTPGDAAANGMVIGEFPQGTLLNGRDVLGGNRLVFLSGSRESGITSEGSGIFDLTPDGEKMFLNAVTYLTTSAAPSFTAALQGATNLVVGDRWTFNSAALGTAPLSYQWYKDGQLLANTESTVQFTSLTAADAGEYYVIVANNLGRATSAVARLEFATFGTPNITNSIVSYWPLNSVIGNKTPDLVSSYDMTLVNMGTTNLVAGKFGQAMTFNNPSGTILQRINAPGEDLPISSKPNFTVSLWVNGPIQPDRRVFSEGSTLQNNTLFNIGTHNGGADGTVDIYIRSDTGGLALDHVHSTATAFDDTWHHIAYVQREVAPGEMRALLYVDGVQDPVVIAPIRPFSPTTTSIGGILRAAASAFYTGMIDEVAVWNRALSPQEIQILQATTITNPPSRLQPLAITTFRADLPAVAKGSSTTLRWDLSKDVTQVTITPDIGDVTARTAGGAGTNLVTLNDTTTFVLTARRGTDTLAATTTVAVVEGIANGWTLLDNFDTYSAGQLANVGYWTDARGNSVSIVNPSGNPALKPVTGDSIALLNLRGLSVKEGESATLFFRMITDTNTASGATNLVGLTDKVQRGYGDAFVNIGPVVYAAALTNDFYAIDTNAWYLGARNGGLGNNTSNPIDYAPEPLTGGTVYNVWINITNTPMNDFMPDIFSVFVQKEGVGSRTNLIQDYASDRDFSYVEAVLGGMNPILDKLIVLGNSATYSAVFDDFYLSKGPYNATIPRPYGFTGSVGPLPAVQIDRSGDQLEIRWTTGTLQEATSLTGTWSDVQGANPPSYTVTPTGSARFYRARR